MSNRIIIGIERAQARINEKQLDAAKIESTSRRLDMEIAEYCRFQEIKSAAVGTKLTLEEAQTVYTYLGNTPEHFNEQSLAVKWTLTNVFMTLLGAKLGR